MGPVVIATLILAGLTILALVAHHFKEHQRKSHSEMLHGIQVLAMVTDVQVRQDWRYSERYYRNPWNGNLEREKTWQTYYVIAAEGVHPQTQQEDTFYCKVWSTDMAEKPTRGMSLWMTVPPRASRSWFNLFEKYWRRWREQH